MEVITTPSSLKHHEPDAVDGEAQQMADQIVLTASQEIECNPTGTLVSTISELWAVYGSRAVGNTIHVGDIVSEQTVFATRTPSLARIDEIFSIDTVYDTYSNQAAVRYRVTMLQADDSQIEVDYTPGTNDRLVIHRVSVTGERQPIIYREESSGVMKDLLHRAFVAKCTYEMRTPEQRLAADQDAREKLAAIGINSSRTSSLE